MLSRILPRQLIVAAMLLAATGCASQAPPEKLFVQTQHDTDVDYAAYQSYGWAAGDATWANPVFLQYPELPGLISAAVDGQLAARGFEKTSPEAADFLVAMSASVQDVTVISKSRHQGWSHGYNRSTLPSGSTATRLDKMSEGTLILEIIDTASEGVVWQARAAGVVTRRDNLGTAVDAAVVRMLSSFPPES